MKLNICATINNFTNEYFPLIESVLLFGSGTTMTEKINDIDLILISECFSYVAKTSIPYHDTTISCIKIPANDVFNIVAADHKDGIYKNIFLSAIVIKDELKIHSLLKRYLSNDYPETTDVIRQRLNDTIATINKSIVSITAQRSSLVEEFLTIGNLINSVIAFQMLMDGKMHFKSHKHKWKMMQTYHPQLKQQLTSIVILYQKGKRVQAIEMLNKIITTLHVPSTQFYSNDFCTDYVDNERCVLFIPSEQRWDDIIPYINGDAYTYYIDKNNVEEAGTYIIFRNVGLYGDAIATLKERYRAYFPYNEYFFHPEIKFGGKKNLRIIDDKLFKIQQVILGEAAVEPDMLVYQLLNELGISRQVMQRFYFYKALNNDHHLTYKDIINCGEAFVQAPLDISGIGLKSIPRYFQLQFIDRVLSMFYLKDAEKYALMKGRC